MNVTLSETEHELVLRLLQSALSDLRVQVRRTSTPDYHDGLQAEERVLEQLVARLNAA
jgi:hypothetical protein